MKYLNFAMAFMMSAISLSSSTASAQSKLVMIPSEQAAVAPGGVDMRSGRYTYNATDLSIAGESGLSLTRTMPNHAGLHANPFGNFSHNWDIFLLESRRDFVGGGSVGNDFQMSVYFGGQALTFESPQLAVGFGYKGYHYFGRSLILGIPILVDG